jgi:uncharacterized protein
VEAMREARNLGADLVVARSRFAADMPALLAANARVPDHEALQDACEQPLAPLAIKGIELHNAGRYFDAHEELELAWMEDDGAGRDLYRGILQVSVAYLQIERGNYRGAVKMLLRVRQWLDPLPAVCRGVDVAALRSHALALHAQLVKLGPDNLSAIDLASMPAVTYQAPGA